MSAAADFRNTASPITTLSLWLASGVFASAVLFVTFVATMELLLVGENVLVEIWPGLILSVAVASYGIFTAYSEIPASRRGTVSRPKLLAIGCSVCLIVALFAMNSAILFRLTHGG